MQMTRLFAALLLACMHLPARGQDAGPGTTTGNVIFIHPDGASASHWHALRVLDKGPDGVLNWDKLEAAGVYTGHLANSVVSSSNGGATAHAYGIKARYEDYGLSEKTKRTSLSGKPYSILMEARKAGLSTAIINSGHIAEPGTGVFASTADSRKMTDTITLQIIESGVDIIMSGGETLLLPEGKKGRFNEPGVRADGKNLLTLAQKKGYTVIYTEKQLKALPDTVGKVLGVFAAYHTFHDLPEETLATHKLPLYEKSAPTVAGMTDKALKILSARDNRFCMIVEEEGSDNFANNNNAAGALEALRRADAAIGVAAAFVENNKQTMIITAADSDAGGMKVVSIRDQSVVQKGLPESMRNGAALDGVKGTGTEPFIAAPDASGERFAFGIAWAGYADVGGGIVSRAHGLNASKLPKLVDNTDVYRMMYLTLFGEWLD